ncbi:MAG TPA: hypothetical protein VGR98_11495 [Streptosporangiaceae bacterium]|nr:hypothetical protein [Streptosporangiaceae bacterium]
MVTPPFPEYPSGHSTFSAAGASIPAAVTGSDTFGCDRHHPGALLDVRVEHPRLDNNPVVCGVLGRVQQLRHVAAVTGGIHFESGDYGGRGLGRQVAQFVWGTAQNYINGYAGKPGS